LQQRHAQESGEARVHKTLVEEEYEMSLGVFVIVVPRPSSSSW
jgi:hypothetical protein